MAIIEKEQLGRAWPLIDLRVHHVAVKRFHYHTTAAFPYNLLICVVESEGDVPNYFTCVESGQRLRLEPGTIYLLPRHLPIRFDRTPEVTGITMRFNLGCYYGMDIYDGDRMIHCYDNPDLVGRIRDLVCNESSDILRTVSSLKSVVMEACVACWPDSPRELKPSIWKYEDVFKHVREHGDAQLTVADLAALHGTRQDVFSRAFKREVGISPKKYIADELLRKVAVYLMTTDLSVKEVAATLNFSSEYYLSRFFKKGTGVPPSEYKTTFAAGRG